MSAALDFTHDPEARTWVEGSDSHPDFPIQNLPLGIFSDPGHEPRGGIAIGAWILDLGALAQSDLLEGYALDAAMAASGATLNPLLALGTKPRRALRQAVSLMLRPESPHRSAVECMLVPQADCTMHLPARIGGYTDFYTGIHHATNVGKLFRPDNPLLPNYKHVPIGYHGRTSSVRATGEDVARPFGQRLDASSQRPQFEPTARLDYELELGFWIGEGNALGEPVAIGQAGDRIAGLCLLNDWSARDVQAWEYQPLGPFLAKNFHSTVSPWIVTAEALVPYRVAQPPRPAVDPQPFPYLFDPTDQARGALSIELGVWIQTAAMRKSGIARHRLSHGQASDMYWTAAQLVAHHTSNGCNLEPGDLLGSGTLSSASRSGFGSLLELTAGGQEPIALPGGEQRTFIEDGDEIWLEGHLTAPGRPAIGLGECRGRVVGPSR